MLADSDTRWKWGVLTARRLAPDARIDGLLLRGRATPTPRQLAEVGVRVDSVREVTGAEFVRTADRAAYDVVVLACVGGAVQAMLHGLAARIAPPPERRPNPLPEKGEREPGREGLDRDADRRPGHRPVLVTGYVGIVYEKLTDGLLLRHGADVVLANSRYDAERFRAVYAGAGADSSAVVECALPFLDGAGRAETPDPVEPERVPRPFGGPDAAAGAGSDTAPEGSAAPLRMAVRNRTAVRNGPATTPPASGPGAFTVVFAVQPSVPNNRRDRAYLLRRAVEHARARPEREVLIKLRSKPGEHTTHIEEAPYQKLAAAVPGGLPANCRLVYGHMGEVLDRTDLLVTVSSTAALESLHRAVPTAVLTDLGIREVLGNHHFLGSGCLASWDQLDAGLLPESDPEWAAAQGVCPPDGESSGCGPAAYAHAFDGARDRVAELTGRAARGELPAPAPYYTPATARGYLPGVLARYGFRPDGTPEGGGAAGREPDGLRGAARSALRDALRDTARGAYRHGVQRVAPVIRRMGEL
ncbi:DUF6716 putative glycosyltransferase [Streptomyces oceani]|uniref:Uncharacterized protein n=1 Tax=Streptomyces oceani TaxID=1075402 RepID=A0A1E7KI31_9ACTN|nr:DUF6716 putative glycosyltransferase [Streptomyces oceani]OEV03632.1 hypothetical protein AN216_10180 [Streptomyces oceani]